MLKYLQYLKKVSIVGGFDTKNKTYSDLCGNESTKVIMSYHIFYVLVNKNTGGFAVTTMFKTIFAKE